MKSFFEKIVSIILDHVLAVVITGAFLVWVYNVGILPTFFLFMSFVLHWWSGWLFATALIVWYLIQQFRNKRQLLGNGAVLNPPEYYASFHREIFEREYADVIWKIHVGTNFDPSGRELRLESVRAWPYPHPHCPACDYELERHLTSWYCMPCRKSYPIPKNMQRDTWEKIRRYYQRLVAQYGYNNFGIIEDGQKPLSVELRELKKRRK